MFHDQTGARRACPAPTHCRTTLNTPSMLQHANSEFQTIATINDEFLYGSCVADFALERRDGSILARGRVSTKPRNLPSRYLPCHPTHLARIEIISPHATAHALAVEVGLQNDSRCLPGRQGSRLLLQDSMRMGLCRVCAASTGCARCEHRFPRSVAPRQLRRLMRYAPPPGPHPVRGAPTAWCQSRPGLAA